MEEVIFEFDIFSLNDEDIISGVKLSPPIIGAGTDSDGNGLTEAPGGVLDLFMGNSAEGGDADMRRNTSADRQSDDTVINEAFYIKSLGPDPNDPGAEIIEVTFRENVQDSEINHKQVWEGVTSITAGGGSGNDLIIVDESVGVPVDFTGGTGNDILSYSGTGSATLSGGDGDDELFGGQSGDDLNGDAGKDKLFGREGNDDLDGGSGMNTLDGGLGVDTLRGGVNDDTYTWSVGDGNDIFVESVGGGTDTIIILGESTVTTTGTLSGVTELDDDITIEPDVIDNTIVSVTTNNGSLSAGQFREYHCGRGRRGRHSDHQRSRCH